MNELQEFVLEFVEEAGGIVESAGPSLYEVLLPQHLAEEWHTSSYLRCSFGDTGPGEALRLGYNHPLVEEMVAAARAEPASTQRFIPQLRLSKTGLDAIAAETWRIPNARVVAQKKATIARVRSTYIQFNFRAAILSDEKQERLVSVLMDAHGGYPVADPDSITSQATALEAGPLLSSLPDAPVRWQPTGAAPSKKPLDEQTLEALLARAKRTVLRQMAAELNTLKKRVLRFRELDEARLNEYYGELERDLRQRLAGASNERRAGLEEKLAAVERERAQKLADVVDRYRLRINLTLLNLLVIQQPKLMMPVNIENRTTQIGVHAVWDPLLHQLEPLTCQVCGEPGQRFYLCFNGHLAHQGCLAPACIDCKRVFCQRCSDDLGQCDVCHAPLCRHSRIICPECGRGTCQAHQELCHANEGAPLDLTTTPDPAPSEQEPAPAPEPQDGRAKTRDKPKPRPKSKATSPRRRKRSPQATRIEVVCDFDVVAAYVLGARDKTIALRLWELKPAEGGIVRTCDCEKEEACKMTNMILRPPSDPEFVAKLLLDELETLRREYNVAAKKVRHHRASTLSGEPVPWPRFELIGLWKNREALEKPQRTFERLYWT